MSTQPLSTSSSTPPSGQLSAVQAHFSQACTSSQSLRTSRSLLVDSPLSSGGLGRFAVSLTVEGTELVWVKEPPRLCLGKIGNGGKCCLLPRSECTIETHMAHQCQLPEAPFLTLQKGPNKGFAPVSLKTSDLDNDLVESLLACKGVYWGSEFSQLKAGHVKSVTQEESNKELVNACKKHMSFKTPAKANALENLLRDINDLTDLKHVISELATMT